MIKKVLAFTILTLISCSPAHQPLLSQVNEQVNAAPVKEIYGCSYEHCYCKYIADAKSKRLHELGIPYFDMRILYGKILSTDEEHVVLRVRYEGKYYWMDDRSNSLNKPRDFHFIYEWSPDSPEWRYVLTGPHQMADDGVFTSFTAQAIITAHEILGSAQDDDD